MLSRGKSSGDSLKSLVNPDKTFKTKKKLKNLKVLSGFASDLVRISGDPPETRTIFAGTTLLVHTVVWPQEVVEVTKVKMKKKKSLMKIITFQVQTELPST